MQQMTQQNLLLLKNLTKIEDAQPLSAKLNKFLVELTQVNKNALASIDTYVLSIHV